jgi:hypothetical protein
MKKWFIGLMLLFSVSVLAGDRIDDEVKKYPPHEYCEYLGSLYHYGVRRHNDGVPLIYKHWDKIEDLVAEPTENDGLYIRDWNNMTDNERLFVSEHITNGWKYADTLNAKVDANQAAYIYYVECMEKKANEYGKERTNQKINFIKTGSTPLLLGQSERMQHPEQVLSDMCKFQSRVAEWTIAHARLGMTEQHFWAVNPLPDGWSLEIKNLSIDIVKQAYAWQGTEEEFKTKIILDCLGTK